MFLSISVDELKSLSDVNIIDVRDFQKYDDGHIMGSINIPYGKLISNPDLYLDKGVKYYIYCDKGITSYSLCKILFKLGYDIISVSGGYEAWLTKK